jgi:hypothetical protein
VSEGRGGVQLKSNKQNYPQKTLPFLYALLTIFLFILFVENIFPQVTINERIEINPTYHKTYTRTIEGDGWWIDNCYIDTYDSSEVDLTFTPASIEPSETTIMTVDYDEELHNFLERTITLESNLGTLVRMPVGGYKYYAPSSTPGDSALVVRIYYEQFLKGMFQRYVSGVYWRWEI